LTDALNIYTRNFSALRGAFMKKLFFALWPEDETRQELMRLQKAIDAKGVRWVPGQNLHATLVFLGNVDEATEAAIKQGVAGISIEPLTLTFDQLSYWSRPRILCLTCRQFGQEVVALAEALDKAAADCGLQTDTRPYTPHITLARQARAVEQNFTPVIWHAKSFCLMESCSEPGGVYYKVLQQWPLAKIAT
jgi:2'-5' RNA ligase